MFIEGNLQNSLDKQQEETRNHKWFHLPQIIVVETQMVYPPPHLFFFFFDMHVYFLRKYILYVGFLVFFFIYIYYASIYFTVAP